jgi:hypothetical protein
MALKFEAAHLLVGDLSIEVCASLVRKVGLWGLLHWLATKSKRSIILLAIFYEAVNTIDILCTFYESHAIFALRNADNIPTGISVGSTILRSPNRPLISSSYTAVTHLSANERLYHFASPATW